MSVPYSTTPTSLSVVIDFTPKIIPSSHPNFEKLKKLVKDPKTTEAEIKTLIDIPTAISKFTKGDIEVIGGKLFYRGFEVRTSLATLILKLVSTGEELAAEPYKRFMSNAYENPDPRAREDLYDWVAASGLPITEDGYILAWKAVGQDYKSIHSGKRGKLDNSIGTTVTEPRNECNADPNKTCSTGLHFCSAPYLQHYAGGGSRIIAVKINPRDVVAFPRDYGLQKGRACEYTVVGEVPADRVNEFYPSGKAVFSGWTPKLGEFKPGQKWKTREGEVVTIKSVSSGSITYPVTTNKGAFYTEKGRFIGDKSNHPFDLISFVA